MAAIDAIVFATAAGFAVIVIATILVIIGVHQEERRKTLAFGDPPTVAALLARRVLGAYIHLLPPERPEAIEPEDEDPPWFERPVGPRAS
jgi:hypothetical protein